MKRSNAVNPGSSDLQSGKGELFNKNQLVKLVLPVVIEQLLTVAVGMADTIMVSSAGEEAMSGVSLVNSICILLIVLFNAMASGGSIVVAQYLGSKNKKKANQAANQEMLACLMISGIITVFALVGNRAILKLIYGSVDPLVMENAVTYFYITAISFPFLAIYNTSSSLFRVMNKAHISMVMSIAMNVINVGFNALFIYKYHMGVAGVAYATLISRVFVGIVMIIWSSSSKYEVHLEKYLRFGWNPDILKQILRLGVPQAMESSLFQVGKLLTQSVISLLGTASIAANACASTVETLANIPGMAMAVALITVVGHCVGAGEYGQARIYTKKLLKVTYIFMISLNIVLLAMAGTIAGWYNLSDIGTEYAIQIIIYHSVCCMLIWPLAFTLPSTLKAAGDVKFTLISSVFSMWVFRIGLAYVIALWMHVGVLGVWIAMTIDWAVRAVLNGIRFLGGKWETKAVVKEYNA